MKTYSPVETFLSLRRWNGVTGVLLPIVIVCLNGGLRPSISHFYYTEGRNWFVGSLFTIGAFLCSYFGYDRVDRVMSTIAGLCAFGVAMFPTDDHPEHTLVGYVHYAFAASLLLILAWFSLFQFRKSSSPMPTPNKLRRNRVYQVCGYIMVIALAAIVILQVSGFIEQHPTWNVIYWLETVCLEAFGISWLVKGEVILKDQGSVKESKTLEYAPVA